MKTIKEKEVSDHESESSDTSEIIEEPESPPEVLVLRKNSHKPQQTVAAAPTSKKNKVVKQQNQQPQSILVNKNEPVIVAKQTVEEVTNHFEETHPKDSVEIHRSAPEEKKPKKNKPVKETPPVSPKNQPSVAPTKSVVDEKPMKKKRSEMSSSAVDGFVSDDISPMIRELTKADLTKNQIQVLIDFLLNKQADTIVADPSEWSESKSDLVQKMKKQLQEAEAKLKNEQDALRGTQNKLKELRAEFNNEKIQSNATLKALTEQIHNGKLEVKNLHSELQLLNDKHAHEKQGLAMSYKQLQAKYLHVQESLKAQEALPSIQQLESDNQLLHQELAKKNQQIMDLNSYIEEESRQKEVSWQLFILLVFSDIFPHSS